MTSANLISYAAQSSIILVAGLLAPRVLRLRAPRAALHYWWALLGVLLLLPVLQPWRLAATGSVTIDAVGMRLAHGIDAVAPRTAALELTEWALVVVASVAAARLAWLGVGLLVLRGYRLGARPVRHLPAAMEELLSRSSTWTSFLVSDRVPTPVTFGWRHPVVLVPPTFERLPEAQQVCIGCHELLHVRRKDWLAVMVEQVLRALLWFHPAVVLLVRKIELSREQLVDREVVQRTGNRRAYLEALMSMASAERPRKPAPALFLLNRSDLRQRIVLLLAQEVRMSRKRVLAALVAACAVVAVVGVSAAAVFPFTTANPVSATASDVEHVRHPVRYDPDANMTAPKIVHKVNPVYPEEAKKNGTQGTVVCETLIDDHGEVVDVKVVETPDEVFNQPTIDAIRQWEFEPATKDGKPVDVIYTLTVKYALE